MSRYRSYVDLHLILRDDTGRVLCGERINTGWGDGHLGLPSGHLEDNEPATTGIAREALEEIGVIVQQSDLRLALVMHHHTDSGRIALFFETTTWSGDITNNEPDKCAGWEFVNTDDPRLLPYLAHALATIHDRVPYSERGWA